MPRQFCKVLTRTTVSRRSPLDLTTPPDGFVGLVYDKGCVEPSMLCRRPEDELPSPVQKDARGLIGRLRH